MLITLAAAALLAQNGADVLAKFAAVEFATKTLTASCTEQEVLASAPGAATTTFAISLAKPNRARIDLPGELIVADGTSITNYDKESKTFMKKPETAAELKALFTNSELCIFGAFFDAGYFDKVRQGKLGKRSRRGSNFDVVETDFELDGKQSAAFYLDPADKMLKMGEFTPTTGQDLATTVVYAKEFAVDGGQGADLYTFKAPEGAHEITLEDLRKANTFVAPPTFVDKALEAWHLYQCDERGNFANGGHDFCGPTAAGNAVTFVGLHGYPKLFQGDDLEGLHLINLLASPQYMGTDPMEGTGDTEVMKGLLKYIGEKGYGVQMAGYESWRTIGRAARSYTLADHVDLDWVRQGVAMPNSIVLFHLGWYKAAGANYNRFQGHWLTVFGYGWTGEGGDPNPNVFIIHNPSTYPRDPDIAPKALLLQDSIKLTPMTGGNLTGNYPGLPRSVSGQYMVTGSVLGRSGGADAAVLDGAIVIVLKPAK